MTLIESGFTIIVTWTYRLTLPHVGVEGIFQGKTTLLVGCGHNDDISTGVKVELRTGDVIVLPAGTGHCNFESTDDLRYIGVYPAVSSSSLPVQK